MQPLDTASTRMQTSAFGKSKGLWATLTDGSFQEAYAGFGASLVLVSNPAIQVLKLGNTPFYASTLKLDWRPSRLIDSDRFHCLSSGTKYSTS